jgi:branched-chain amino acid transport system ATP-binding protein
MLMVANLVAGYGRIEILHSISISVPRSKITALVGANGAGKTTLLRSIIGLVPTSRGTITLDETSIEPMPAFRRVALGLAMSPEGRMVFPGMSVAENIRLGAISIKSKSEIKTQTERVLELFPRLKERLRQAAGSLSGGEQQMLAFGRALMASPKLLLLDEPTLGLAPIMADQIFECMRILRNNGLTMVVAEQDTRRVLQIADKAYVIENGRVALEGAGVSLLDDPTVKRAFLGI